MEGSNVVTVHLGTGASVSLALIGEHGSIDLTAYAAMLLARSSSSAPHLDDSGVEFATLALQGPVRFFRNGRRISNQAGLESLADGVRSVLLDALDRREGRDGR
jgi:hypothetical protein